MSAAAAVPAPIQQGGLTLPRLIRAEWIKIRSVRSTWWTLGVAVLLMFLFAWLVSANINEVVRELSVDAGILGSSQDEIALQATVLTLRSGTEMAAIVMAVFGALVVTGEYSTGMIRSTFLADPKRLGALTAKAVILSVVVFATAIIGTAAAYLIATPGLSNAGVLAGLDEQLLWRSMAGGGLYLVAVALITFALGFMLRRAAGTISTSLGLILILPNVLIPLNIRWVNPLIPYLPSMAGGQLTDIGNDPESYGSITLLTPGMALVVTIAWVVVLTTAAAVLVRRRDA